MDDILAGIGEVDIVGMDADMQALLDDMLECEGVSGLDEDGLEDIDLSDIAGEVEIGALSLPMNFRKLLVSKTKAAAKAGARKGYSTGVRRTRAAVSRAARPAVRESAPKNAETALLGFQRDATKGGVIAAGTSAQVVAEPQRAFKPEALIIDDSIAPDFLINEIKIGTRTLFVNSNGVPASMFRADGVLGRLLLNKTGQVSQQLVIDVTNISTSARPFYAAMVGWSAD